jgi:hypothetical protein
MRHIFYTIIDFLDIIHNPVFLLKNNVSETGLRLRPPAKAYLVGPNLSPYGDRVQSPKLKPTQLGPICPRPEAESSLRNWSLLSWAQSVSVRRQSPVSETFLNKRTRRCIMSKKSISVLIYHCQKRLDLAYILCLMYFTSSSRWLNKKAIMNIFSSLYVQ